MFRFKFITTLFVVLSLACNISVLQAKLIEKSSKKTPDWIGKNFEDKKKLYFSGASTQSSFDKARQLAINDALTQVTQSLDLTMSVNTQHIISDTGIFLDEKTKTKTRAVRLLDTKIKDIYYEKYEENGKYHYSVHALVEYNKKDYDEEKARLANEYAQLKQNVVNRYAKAKQLIVCNNVLQALPELMEALRIIYVYGVNQPLEQEIVALINDVLDDISFKNSFSISDEHSGIKTDIVAYFDKTKEVCSKYIFTLKSLNGFSIETIPANEEGKIDYSFNKVSYLKKSNYKLDLNLQKTFNLEEDFLKNYSFKTVSDELNFLGNKKKISLNISSNKNKNELAKILSTSLVQNGFVIVNNNADYILNLNFNFVEIAKTELKKLQSDDTLLFISKANIVADLVSSSNNTQINSVSTEARGFGKTENQSYFDLLQKVSTSVINSL